MRIKTLSVILLMLVGARFFVAPLGAQSLAALAKQEEERRKTITKPTKVLTNRDLTAAPPSSAPAAAAPSAKAGSATADDADNDRADASKGAAKSDGAPKAVKDKAYWSGRQNDLQSELSRDQTYADALQARINALNTDFVNRDDPAQRAAVATQRQKATDELSRLTKQIATERKALADLQEEARKAGVPAGWLR